MQDDDRSELATRADIELLVRAFYEDAATDGLLRPIFDAADLDWPEHIERLTDFWAWQLLGQKGYGRNPLRAHEPVHARTPFVGEHYERWLELFIATVDRLFVGAIADTAKGRATKMAHALERLLAGQTDRGSEPTEILIVGRTFDPP